ncbi:ATP-binding protein [Streptomyces microflavus]|uniref:ATP-binding protein n=1 Tax=Streptomyces microflavus TaxID=1919 RepID=UPI003660CACD
MTCLYVPPIPESAGIARRWAAPLLPAAVRDPVVLVVSELVTNAVAADAAVGATDDIEVELVVDPAGRHVALAVTDASDQPLPPIPAVVAADQDSGRGLLLLEALAHDHGWAPPHLRREVCLGPVPLYPGPALFTASFRADGVRRCLTSSCASAASCRAPG